ncbi:interleukin-1 beta [Acanthopagrus latus]|uniref:interleukin-1 beta n=1 Tax=Acanthopagrus latus TaxID=8177 RepID=UPI00187C7403|nr:interleukin-1 beta [Acanthopagrus latus]
MCDFHLSQALDSPTEEDDVECETRHLSLTHCDMPDGQDKTFRLEDGLDLVVSHNPMSLQCVVHLMLAVNRLKKSLPHCGKKLSDDELCCAILDSLVEDSIVKTTENCTMGEKRSKFKRIGSVNLCTLCDTSKKHVICVSEEMKLQAITLKGGHGDRKVNFRLSKYIDGGRSESLPVVLSITENLHISCSMKDGRPELNLEECSEVNLQTISRDDNMDRFLFYRRDAGLSHITFESVRYSGWFISTCEGEEQPVEMCEAKANRRLTSFKIN